MRRKANRILLILLCFALGLPLLGFSLPRKVKALHPQFADQLVYAELDGQPVTAGELDRLQVSRRSVLRVYLVGEDGTPLFLDQDGAPLPTQDITMSRLRAAGVDVQLEPLEAQGVTVTASLAYRDGGQTLSNAAPCLELEFVLDDRDGTARPFALECGIAVRGKLQAQSVLLVAGTAGGE